MLADQEERYRSQLGIERVRVKELERQLESERSDKVSLRVELEGARVRMQELDDGGILGKGRLRRRGGSSDDLLRVLRDAREQDVEAMAEHKKKYHALRKQVDK